MLNNKIAIIGYSGHSFVVLEACGKIGLKVNYYCDINEKFINPYNLNYLGSETNHNFDWNIIDIFILGIGNNNIRKKAYELLIAKGKKVKSIIHPNTSISKLTNIGNGTFVSSGVNVNVNSKIGVNCIINTAAVIEHDCNIGKHTHIGPGAVLLGNVNIGNNCFIGANSVVKENTIIGDNVIVGAGSVVLKNVVNNETVVGNPAKRIKYAK